ncbi:MAG: hypothetical protein GY798_19030 [Hyphomicrobiales bacterium]|nr:hypothetical protein [Hyphomicrobiales bacterium]
MSDLGLASISWLQDNIFLFAACFSIAIAGAAAVVAKATAMFELSPSGYGLAGDDAAPTSLRAIPHWHKLLLAILAGAAIVGWLVLSVSWEAFTYWDNHIFFRPLRGEPQFTPPPIFPESGRFYPLGHQEFEWLALVDGSGVFYRVFFCFQLVTVCICSVLLVRTKLYLSLLMMVAIVLTPGIVTTFIQLIYPERNIIFLLALYFLFLKRFLDSGGAVSVFVSTAALSLTIFYKETVFVVMVSMGVFLLSPLVFSKKHPHGNRFIIAAVPPFLVSIIFLSYYYGVVAPLVESAYGDQRVRPLTQVIERTIGKPWIWVLGVSLGLRVWQLIRTGGRIDPFWDGVAAASCALIAAYFALGYDAPHFYVPAAYAAWLFAFHMTQTLRPRKVGTLVHGVFVAFIAVSVIAQLNATWNGLRGRKEFVHSRASAARFVADYAAIKGLGTAERPLYVHPLPSVVFGGGLFGGFIEAKYGLNVVVAISDETTVDGGPCIEGAPVRCVFRPAPQPGELVVALIPRFARDLQGRDGLRLLFVTEDIGFWRNRHHASVFAAE